MSEKRIAIIILAAGAASRMGRPKQLLKFEGETLLRRAARAALETGQRPIVVVLGSQANALLDELASLDVLSVVNQSWQEGMSSSIRCGLERALAASVTHDEIEAALLMLCDQPLVTSDVLRRLVDAHRIGPATLVAAEYEAGNEKTLGVPAIFSRALFPELMVLNGAEGAKRIIARHRTETLVIPVPEAAFDIDTPADYRTLRKRESLKS